MNFTKIRLYPENRMVRFGFGVHDSKWFVRLDLWFVAYRLTF